jgi:PhzF family phenazine biosynthesis protein
MPYPFFIVDAFVSSSEYFLALGNPAAVVILDQPQADTWLQNVAAEFNLSETAFLWAEDDRDATRAKEFKLRWFTPTCEVKLCGHATLAAVHTLATELGNANKIFSFATLSGNLTAGLSDEKIHLDFPRTPLKRLSNIFVDENLSELKELGMSDASVYQADNYLLIELENEAAITHFQPKFNLLTQLPADGIIITARSENPEFDFVSRFFAPALGVNEDPATGSAHCALAPFWENKLNKKYLRAKQVSQRGGYLEMELGDGDVELRGQCKTFAEGQFIAL